MFRWLQGKSIVVEGHGATKLLRAWWLEAEQGDSAREEGVRTTYSAQGHTSLAHPDTLRSKLY